MESGQTILRPLRRADLPACLRLKDLAGWNQVEEDWALFLDLSPGGSFGLEKDGALIATSTAIAYGRAFGWVGMMLVHPDERRKGHGRTLLAAAVSSLEERGVVAGLDATALGKPLYESFGFRDVCAVERWTGTAPEARPGAGAGRSPRAGCEPIGPSGLEEALPLDRDVFGADRSGVLLGLLARPDSRGLVLPAGEDRDPAAGYILVRRGSRYFHLGPWVARSPEAAARLLDGALAAAPGVPVCVDILAPNEAARSIARRSGLAVARTLWRMVRGTGGAAAAGAPPGGDPARVYGLAGLEWG